jgi:hypothetical protein
MISSAAHPRRPPSWISLRFSDCLCLIGGDWRKVSFDDQRRRSFKMAATAAILDFVSVDYLANARVDWSDLFVAYWG